MNRLRQEKDIQFTIITIKFKKIITSTCVNSMSENPFGQTEKVRRNPRRENVVSAKKSTTKNTNLK